MLTDFSGITTTRNRTYDPDLIAMINENLKRRNFSREDRAILLGSIIEESGGNPFSKSKDGKYRGLLQWEPSRYQIKSKNKIAELNNQIQYIVDTIDNTQDGQSWSHGGTGSGYKTGQEAHNAFRNSEGFDDKFRALSYGFVRPSGGEASYKNRVKTGSQVLNRLVVDEVLSKPKPKMEKWVPMPFTTPKPYKSSFHYAEGGSLTNHWDSLPMKDKSEMMRVAISNGITTLPEIKEAYNKFAEGGPKDNWTMEDEAGYRYWRQNLPKNLRNTNDNEYDMRAAYKAGMQPMWNDYDKAYHLQSRDPESGRILKSPYHSTYLEALMEDASMGYYPTIDSKGHTYTKTWKGNTLYPKETREIEVPFKAYGGNLYGDGGDTRMTNSDRAMGYLMSRGMSQTGAAAIVGTLRAESGLDPTIHARMKGDDGEGLAQWTGSRKKNFWTTLEQIEPGAQKRYKNISSVPLERQLDVILAERPEVARAIHEAQDVNTATDIMLRGYENGGGNMASLASKKQMDRIYGKWNNGYDNQMKVRLNNANNLLGFKFDPSQYNINQTFFDDINNQIAALPDIEYTDNMKIDPTTIYKPPTIDETMFQKPEPTPPETVYNPQEERMEGIRNFNRVMGLVGMKSPIEGLIPDGSTQGLLSYVNQIYS